MSDNYFQEDRSTALRTWVLGRMLAGAGYAAIFVLAIAAILVVTWGIGLLLPAESKQAPSPYSALEIAAPAEIA